MNNAKQQWKNLEVVLLLKEKPWIYNIQGQEDILIADLEDNKELYIVVTYPGDLKNGNLRTSSQDAERLKELFSHKVMMEDSEDLVLYNLQLKKVLDMHVNFKVNSLTEEKSE